MLYNTITTVPNVFFLYDSVTCPHGYDGAQKGQAPAKRRVEKVLRQAEFVHFLNILGTSVSHLELSAGFRRTLQSRPFFSAINKSARIREPPGYRASPIQSTEYERDFHPRLSPVISGRLGYLYGTSALYHSPVSSCVQRRPTYFPGQGLRKFLRMTGPKAVPDSSSTGGVCCVGGRIPALCGPTVCNAPCLSD